MSTEPHSVAGSSRRTITTAGLALGVAPGHAACRSPEVARAGALADGPPARRRAPERDRPLAPLPA